MNGNLFLNLKNDPLQVPKEFFNSIYNTDFADTIGYLVKRIGCIVEHSGCIFPDPLDLPEDFFEGVMFWYFDDKLVVSEEIFKDCLKSACEKYVEFNPDKSQEIGYLLSEL